MMLLFEQLLIRAGCSWGLYLILRGTVSEIRYYCLKGRHCPDPYARRCLFSCTALVVISAFMILIYIRIFTALAAW
jgi:hypothetical protein